MPPKAKSDRKLDEEHVSLTRVSELLQQRKKEMFTALLCQKQENYKN